MDYHLDELRFEDINEFNRLCLSMTEAGLEDAFDRHNKDDLDKKITSLRGKWEAYHLVEYAGAVAKKVGKETLSDAYKENGLTAKSVQSIPTYRGGKDPDKQARVFKSLAKAQHFSKLQVLIDFLEFCRDGLRGQMLPLGIYSDDKAKLVAAINDKKAYLEKQIAERESRGLDTPNKERKFDGLGIYWRQGNNSHEKPVCKIEPCFADRRLRIPETIDNKDLEQPSTILGWSSQLTQFIGRERELEHLKSWLNSDPEKSIQLITGEGGTGKTRLAFHFAEEIAYGLGWESGQATSDLGGNWFFGEKGILLVIDYPEERKTTVRQFLKSIYEMEPLRGKRLRVLLLSRDREFFDVIEEEAPRLSNPPLHLTGLDSKESQWNLVNSAWEGLQRLKIASATPLRPDSQFAELTLDANEFFNWQQKDEINQTPLMVMSLIYYLFSEPDAEQKGILELTAKYIIRYMTKREIRFIRKEVEEYFGLKKLQSTSESIFFLRALAALNEGKITQELVSLINKKSKRQEFVGNDGGEYLISLEHIREFSFFADNQLTPILPDILASDFLAYCLTECNIPGALQWLVIILFEPLPIKTIVERNSEILSNFSRLTRLIHDAQIVLKLEGWPVESLIDSIVDSNEYCHWVSFFIGVLHENNIARLLLYKALMKSLNVNYGEFQRTSLIASLALCKDYIRDKLWLIKKLEESAIFLENSLKNGKMAGVDNKSQYSDEEAIFYDYVCMLNSLSIIYAEQGAAEKSLQLTQYVVSALQPKLKADKYGHFRSMFVLAATNLCNRLNQKGEKLKAVEYSDILIKGILESELNLHSAIYLVDATITKAIALIDLMNLGMAMKAIEFGREICRSSSTFDPMTFKLRNAVLITLEANIEGNRFNTQSAETLANEAIKDFTSVKMQGFGLPRFDLLMASSLSSVALALLNTGNPVAAANKTYEALALYQRSELSETPAYSVDIAKTKIVHAKALFAAERYAGLDNFVDDLIKQLKELNTLYSNAHAPALSECIQLKASLAFMGGSAEGSLTLFHESIDCLSEYPEKTSATYFLSLAVAHMEYSKAFGHLQRFQRAIIEIDFAIEAINNLQNDSVQRLQVLTQALFFKTAILLSSEEEAISTCKELLVSAEALCAHIPDSLIAKAIYTDSLFYLILCEKSVSIENISNIDNNYIQIRDFHDAPWIKDYPKVLRDLVIDGLVEQDSKEHQHIKLIIQKYE